MAVQEAELFPAARGPELPELDRFERLEVISKNLGFLPVTKTEQVDAMGLESLSGTPGGAAKHLAEVIVKQRKEGVADPHAAARKIVRNYIGYMRDATASAHDLTGLREELYDANPELAATRVVDAKTAGVLSLKRFMDLSKLRDSRSIEAVGYDPQRVDYSPENGGIMAHLEMDMDSWSVRDMKLLLGAAVEDQSERFMFFAERLSEVQRHSDGRLATIAREGLEEFFPPQHV